MIWRGKYIPSLRAGPGTLSGFLETFGGSLGISQALPSPRNETILLILLLLWGTNVPVLFSSSDFNLFVVMVILQIYLWHRRWSGSCPYYNSALTMTYFTSRFQPVFVPRVGSGMGAVKIAEEHPTNSTIPRKIK